MRFLELDFAAYGPFSGLRLQFPTDVGLHLVYGPNESGKSSALRAVRGLLYGIPSDGRDEFLHPSDALRVRAELQHSQGATLTVTRRKGRGKKTLLDTHGKPFDHDPLRRFLGGVDRELFHRLYGLDHRSLSEGGKALLAEGGKIAESLFAAGLGPGFAEVRDRLRDDAEKLWKPRSRSLEIDKAIETYRAAQKKAIELSVSAQAWQRLCTEQQQEDEKIATLEHEIRRLDSKKQRLSRFFEAHAPLTARAHLRLELAALGDLPELSPDFPHRRQELQASLATDQAQLARLRENRLSLEARLKALPQDHDIVEHAPVIERLQRGLDTVLDAEAELPVTRAKYESSRRSLSTLARDLGLDGESRDWDALPDAPTRAQVRRLAERYRRLLDEGETLRDRLALAERQGELLSQRQSALGNVDDISGLEASLKQLRAALGLDTEILNLQAQLAARSKALTNAHSGLPGWSGSLEELIALRPPKEGAFEEVTRGWEALQRKLHDTVSEREASQKRGQAKRAELAALTKGETLRSRQELQDSREVRDALWQELLELKTDERSLYVRLERALRDIDLLTDQLLDNAARVAQVEHLEKELEGCRQEWSDKHERVKAYQRDLEALQMSWSALWSSPHLDVAPPATMRTWLVKRESVVTLCLEEQALERALQEAMARREQELERHRPVWRESLPAGLGETVESAIARAEQALSPRLEAAQERARLGKEAERLQLTVAETEVALLRHGEQLSQWRQEWSASAVLFRRPVESSPSDLESLLERFEELRQLKETAEAVERAMSEQTSRSQEFRTQLTALLEQLGDDASGGELAVLTERLVERLAEQRRAQVLRQQLEEQLELGAVEIVDLEARLVHQQAQWNELLKEAGVEDGLAELEAKVIHRQQLAGRLRDLEETLRPLAVGSDVDELARQLAAQDFDELPGQIRELERRIADLEQERERAWYRKGELQQELTSFDGAEVAAEAAQVAAEAMSEGKALVARYARLALAEAVLKREMERYRQDNEAPLLGHASGWFRRLTTRAYEGLSAGNDPSDDSPRLEAVSASGRRVPVEGLSDGTRDQLFLALRLATIELSLDAAEPVPMVMDDVLVQFDTERAKATLEVLAEFARRNQILLFTHLERDRQLALDLGEHRANVLDLEPVAL